MAEVLGTGSYEEELLRQKREAEQRAREAKQAQEMQEATSAATEEGAKVKIGPSNRPFTEEQSFLLKQRKAVRESEWDVLETRGLTKLPETLEPHKEFFEKQNKKGNIIPGDLTDWGSNRIAPDYSSFKNQDQAAYFASTLEASDDVKQFYKEYANATGGDYEQMLSYAEDLLGDRLSVEPLSKTNKNKKIMNGIASYELIGYDGKAINVNSCSLVDLERAIKSHPDKAVRGELADWLIAATKQEGNRFYGADVTKGELTKFNDTAALPSWMYSDFVGDVEAAFDPTPGSEEKNEAKYQELMAIVDNGNYSDYQKYYLRQAVERGWKDQLGTAHAKAEEAASQSVTENESAKPHSEPTKNGMRWVDNAPGFQKESADSISPFHAMEKGLDYEVAEVGRAELPAEGTVHMVDDPVRAVTQYVDKQQGNLLDNETRETVNKLVQSSPVAKMVLGFDWSGSQELYEQAKTDPYMAGKANEARLAYLTGDVSTVVGSTLGGYYTRIQEKGFPEELVDDAKGVILQIGFDAETAYANSEFSYDPEKENMYEAYLKYKPDALNVVSDVFKAVEQMKQEERDRAKLNADAAAKAEADRLKQSQEALQTTSYTQADIERVANAAPVVTRNDAMKDPTFSRIMQEIALDRTFSDGEEGGFYNDHVVDFLMGMGKGGDLNTVEAMEYKDMLKDFVEAELLKDERIAESLGYKDLNAYYAKQGGFSMDNLQARAAVAMQKFGASLNDDDMAKAEQLYTGTGEDVSAWDIVSGGAAQGALYVASEALEALWMMDFAGTENRADAVASVRKQYCDTYTPALASYMYEQDMLKWANEGDFPNKEVPEYIKTYLASGADPFQLGRVPDTSSLLLQGAVKTDKAVEAAGAWAQEHMTPTQGKVFEVSSAGMSNTIMQAMASTITAMTGSALAGTFLSFGMTSAYPQEMREQLKKGRNLSEANVLGLAHAATTALAEYETSGKFTNKVLQAVGLPSAVAYGMNQVGKAGATRTVGGMLKAFGKGAVKGAAEMAWGELVKDELKDKLLWNFAGGSIESKLDGASWFKAMIDGVANMDTGKAVEDVIGAIPEGFVYMSPMIFFASMSDGFSATRRAAQKLASTGTAEAAKEFVVTAQAEIQQPENQEAFNKAVEDIQTGQIAAGVMASDPEVVPIVQNAQKKQEQRISHEEELAASKERYANDEATFDACNESGDVEGAIAAFNDIPKAQQGINEHQREAEQAKVEEDRLFEEATDKAVQKARKYVQNSKRLSMQVLADRVAAIEKPEDKVAEIGKQIDMLLDEADAAEAAGDTETLDRLIKEQAQLYEQQEAIMGSIQQTEAVQTARTEAESALAAQDAEAAKALEEAAEHEKLVEEKATMAPVYRDLRTRPIYVDKQQAANIKSATGLTIQQFNRKYGMALTTDKNKEGAISLDGSFFEDLAQQAPGYIDAQALHPEDTLIALANRKKELAGVKASIGETNADAYITDVTLGTQDPVTQKIASDLKKNTGIDLVTANLEDGVRGWYDRKNNQLVLSNKLGAGELRRIVIMHELTHFIENSTGYQAYKNAVLKAAYEGDEKHRKELMDKDRQDVIDLYAEHGVSLTPDEVDYELVAAATEKVISGDEAFFEGLINGGKRSFVQRVYLKVKQFLAKMKAKKLGPDALAQYESIQNAHDLMEKALQSAPRGAQGDGGVQYAVTDNERWYDYSKKFSEQIDDWINGDIREGDTLVMGGTPKVLQDIGFNNLPMTFDQKHLREMLRTYKNEDHHIDIDVIKRLPELVADPVAIIEADVENRDNSVLIILGEKNENAEGRTIIGAINVKNGGQQNGKSINATRLITAHSRGDLDTLIKEAVKKEQNGDIGVYYVNKKALPNSSQNNHKELLLLEPDGFVHSIHDAKSPVNSRRIEQKDSEQFIRFMKGSVVVNADNTPKVMYRGGGEDIDVFDRKKSSYSNLYGRGFYFTESKEHAKSYGEVRPYYLSVKHPLSAISGTKSITDDQLRAFLEAVAGDEDYGLDNYGYGATVDSVLKSLKGRNDFDVLQDINATAIGDFVAAVELFNKVNGTNYDGIITPTETVVFDSRQIKSADKNIGLFDPNNPNVKYSIGIRQYGNNTAQRSDFISDRVKELVKDSEYERDTNEAQVKRATKRMDSLGGAEAAAAVLLNKEKKSYTADDNALAFVAMAEATRNGDDTTAAMLAMRMLEESSEQGRALQSIQIALKLSPEGAMAEAIRKADRTNESHGMPAGSFPVGEGKAKKGGTETRADGTTVKTPEVVDQVYRDAAELNNVLNGLAGEVSYDNPWQLALADWKMALISAYKLSGEKLAGSAYNVASVKQRMLAAIIAADNGLQGEAREALCQQLEAMNHGYAVVTTADLNYIASQMAEFRLVEGADATVPKTQAGREALGRAFQAQDNVKQEGLMSKWTALRFMNMLSAPATAVRNISSNVLASGLENASTAIASVIDKSVSKKTGTRTTAMSTKAERREGNKKFAGETAQTFMDYFVRRVDTGHGRKYATGGQGRVFESAFLEGCRNLVDFAMQVGDRPFYEKTYAQELATVKRLDMKVSEMKDGKIVQRSMTEDEMHQEATARALKRVFQEDNAVISAMNKLKADSPEMDLFITTLMPFIKTPTNIAMRAIEYSPVGLGITLARRAIFGMDSGRKRSISQRDFVMGIGRGLTGSALLGAGYALAASGIIGFGRGDEEDEKRRGILSALGRPYNMFIQIGDTRHEIDWALPMSSALAMGAELFKSLDSGEGMVDAVGGAIINGVGEQLMSTPMLSAMNDIFRGYDDTQNTIMRLAKTSATSMINQTFSPAVIRAIAKATDPYVRDTSSQNSVWSTLNQNVVQYWPGLRQMLPIKTDLTGDLQLQNGYWNPNTEQGNAMLQMLDSFFTPTATIGDKNDDQLMELLDLSYTTGESSFLPADLISAKKYELKLNKTTAKALRYGDEAITMTLTDEEKRNINTQHGDLLFNGDGGRSYRNEKGKAISFPGLRAVMTDQAKYSNGSYKQNKPWSQLTNEERVTLVDKMRTDAKNLVTVDVAKRKKEAGEI